jgi:hypothetical protein
MSLFGGIASAVGSIVGAGASYLGSQAQAKAANKAGDQAYAIYQQQRKDLAPQRELGYQATNRLRDIYINGTVPYTTDPGYAFRMGEGTKALERGAAARGGQLSGAQQKALTRYGQDYGSAEYNNGFNRMSQLAGFGSQAVQQGNQAAGQYAVNIGNAGQNAAAARSSGYEGIGSSINSGVNNLLTLRALQGLY